VDAAEESVTATRTTPQGAVDEAAAIAIRAIRQAEDVTADRVEKKTDFHLTHSNGAQLASCLAGLYVL
jgi:hypothetical protein